MQQVIWIIWFLVGEMAHINLKIHETMQSSKKGYLEVLKALSAIFLYRGLACMFFFVMVSEGHILDLLTPLHLNLPAWSLLVLKWPMNWALAGLYGLALDSISGYCPGLKNVLPQEGGS